MNDEHPLSKGDSAAREIEQPADNNPAQSKDEYDRKMQILIDQGHEILTKLDPAVREELSGQPEKLAEWDALMQEYAQIVAEEQASLAESEIVSAKEAEEARLSREISERMDMISSDLDRFMDRQGPDLEIDAALERNFAAMHELDAVMRQACQDFPAQLADWEAVMEYLEEVEMRYAAAMEAENAQPEN